MSRTLHLFGTDWCAMMVPIHALQWYRLADTVTFGYKIDNPMAKQMIDDAVLFIRMLDELISDILYPRYDYTQAAMNSEAIAAFNKADEELEGIIQNIKNQKDDFEYDFSYSLIPQHYNLIFFIST